MEKAAKKSIDYYIHPNKIMCCVYGLWPVAEGSSKCKRVIVFMHLAFSVILVSAVFVPEAAILAANWRDLSIVAGAGALLMTLVQFLFKTTYLLMKRESVYRLIEEMRDLWATTDVPEERQSYETFAHWGRYCTLAFFSSAVLATLLFLGTATLDFIRYVENGNVTNRYLPFDVWQQMGNLASPKFEMMYACQIVGTIKTCCASCGMDGMCWTTILFLSGQFRLITTWLNNIGIEMNYKPVDLKDCRVKVAADLVKCIRHHQRLARVINEANDLLVPIMFTQILTSGIQICLSGFAVLSNSSGDNLVKFTCLLAAVLVQLFMYCLPGEVLIQESQEVAYAAYLNVPWYQLPPSDRRQLILVIMKSQEGACVSTLTFNSLGCRTLTGVFNAGSSYFALLRNIQETGE